MKRLMAIETTADYLGLALLVEEKGNIFVKSIFKQTPMRQAELLIPALETFLRRQKLKGTDVDIWAVDVGPGSFTGVRVGVAAGRALAQGFKKPLIGVSSLDALAHAAWKKGHFGLVAAVLPAVAGEVYGSLYEAGQELRCRWEPQWLSQADFDAKISSLCRRSPQLTLLRTSEPAHPESIAHIAWGRYADRLRSSRFHYNEVAPLYLQPSWAERAKHHATRS